MFIIRAGFIRYSVKSALEYKPEILKFHVPNGMYEHKWIYCDCLYLKTFNEPSWLQTKLNRHKKCIFITIPYTWVLIWSGFEAAKTVPWPNRGLHRFGKFLEPSDEWTGRGCGDIVGDFWLIRNELQKLVEVKFEFFSFNTFDVSQIFWQRVVKTRPKYSYRIFLKHASIYIY